MEPLLRGQVLPHKEMSYLFGGLLVLCLLRSTYFSTLLLGDSTDSESYEDITAGMEPHSSSRKQKGMVSRHYFLYILMVCPFSVTDASLLCLPF